MNWLKENWLKLVETSSLVLVAFSVAYYFLVFLPKNINPIEQNQQNLPIKQSEQIVQIEPKNTETATTTIPISDSQATLPKPEKTTQSSIITNTKTFSEGWIEKLKPNSALAGWAFDNNKPITVNLTFKEIDIGFEGVLTGHGDTKNGSSGSFYFSFRKDVEDLVRQKSIEPYVRTGFQLNIKKGDLPTGFYKLVKATYNGKSFMIQEPNEIYHFEKCYMSGSYYMCE